MVAEAADGQQAIALAVEHRPDIALVDIQMPVLDGIEATRQIVADPRLAGVRVVILTNYGLDEYIFRALRAGASGFLLKDTHPAELLQALRAAERGDALLSPAVAYQAALVGEHDELGAVACAELGHRPADVGLGRGSAEHHGFGYFVVVQSVGDQGDDFTFPVGQRLHSSRGQHVRWPGDELTDQPAGDPSPPTSGTR